MRYFLATYPAARLLFCAVAGILAAMALPAVPVAWLAVALVSTILALIFALTGRRRALSRAIPSYAVLCYLLAVGSAFALHASSRFLLVPEPSLISWTGRDVILSGVAEGRPDISESGVGFRLRVSELFHDGRTMHLDDRASIFIKVPPGNRFRLEEGDFVRVKGRPGLIPLPANRGEFDQRLRARYQGVHVQLYCPGPWSLLREPSRGVVLYHTVVNPVRRYLAGSIDARFPPGREAQFVKGMILGEQELLPETLNEAFRRTGTAHVIAVSGLHVALLALAVNLVLQRLKVTRPGKWIAFGVFVLVLSAYSFVTGNAPSIKRAAIMSAVMIGGGVLGRRTFAVNSLAVSDLLILLFDPFDLFNAGFLMTNGAVLGILLLHEPLAGLVPGSGGLLRSALSAVWSAFCVSLSAMAGVSPVIAFMFGTFSLSGMVANLPVVLFSNLAMYSAMPLFLFHGTAGWLASLFGMSSWLMGRLTIFCTLFFSALPLSSIEIRPDLFEVTTFYLVLGVVLFFLLRHRWGRAAVALLLGVNIMFWHELLRPVPHPPGIVTVNLGRQMAVLFSSGSETVLVDAGRTVKSWDRIARQAEAWGIAAPTAAVAFMSPDSVLRAMPVRHRIDSSGNSLVLRSIVVTRLGERVIRIDSRRRSALLVSGMGRLMETKCTKADVAMIWIYRFTGKQWRELDSWIGTMKPVEVLLVPGPFMTAAQRALLARYAASRKGVSVRSRTSQTIIP